MAQKILFLMVNLILACTDQGQSRVDKKQTTHSSETLLNQEPANQKDFYESETFRSALKFIGQVEIEIIKLLDSKFKSSEKIPSQLNILSQLFELKFNKNSHVKQDSIFFDCFQIEFIKKNINEVQVFKKCEKNSQLISEIKKIKSNNYEFQFKQAAWQKTIGDSALLNLKDKICNFSLMDSKVSVLDCKDTLLTVGVDSDLEEIKLHQYTFNRNSKEQINIKGGRFKNFIERSLINISIPEEGKIKFKEIEIKIKDDFEPPKESHLNDDLKNEVPAEKVQNINLLDQR